MPESKRGGKLKYSPKTIISLRSSVFMHGLPNAARFFSITCSLLTCDGFISELKKSSSTEPGINSDFRFGRDCEIATADIIWSSM